MIKIDNFVDASHTTPVVFHSFIDLTATYMERITTGQFHLAVTHAMQASRTDLFTGH